MSLTAMDARTATRLRGAQLTYSPAGGTAGGLPPGYHHPGPTAGIATGPAAAAGAADSLLGWQAHLRAGLAVSASAPVAGPGTLVLLGIAAGLARLKIG